MVSIIFGKKVALNCRRQPCKCNSSIQPTKQPHPYGQWDLPTNMNSPKTSDIHNLEQVQRRADRFIHPNYTDRTPGCVTNMVKSLGWESLQHRRYTDRVLSMLFQIQHGLVDVTSDYIQPNETRIRGSQCLRQLQATKDVYKFSVYPCSISDWNGLPTTVTDVQSLQEFREGLSSLPPQVLQLY